MFSVIYGIISRLLFGLQGVLNYHLTTKDDYQFSTVAINTIEHIFIVIIMIISIFIGYFFPLNKFQIF